MEFIKFILNKHQCNHDKVSPQEDVAYCPDCGELIENRWYIVRCDCCGIKLKAIYKDGKVISEEKFCHNCGSKHFTPEQVSKINCIDINYAVPVKLVITPHIKDLTQSWQDYTPQFKPKLIGQT